jgi:hypothetical protein
MTGNPNHDEKGKFASGAGSKSGIFEQAHETSEKLHKLVSELNETLKDITSSKMKELGLQKSSSNLTPDAVRATAEWKQADASLSKAFKHMQDFNRYLTKTFGKDYEKFRRQKVQEQREAKLAKSKSALPTDGKF